MLVGKRRVAARHAELIITQCLHRGRARQGGAGRGVVDFVGRAHAGDHHAGLGDVGRDRAWLHQIIVGRVRALQTEAAEDHGFAVAGVLVGKRRVAARHAELINAQRLHRGCARQCGAGRGVVDFVGRAHAGDHHAGLGDVGGDRAWLHQIIVGRVRALQTEAAEDHGFAAAGVLVGKRRVAARHAELINAQRLHRGCARQCGAGRGVVDFVGRAHAGDDHAGLGDVGGDRAWLHQIIVGRVGALQTEAAEDHGFAVAGVLVGKRRAAARHAELINAQRQHRGLARQGGLIGRVVDFVGRTHAGHHHAGLGDVGRDIAWLHEVIVGRVRALQGVAADDHGFAVAGALVGKRCAAARHAELVVAQRLHRGLARQGGAGRGVVDFVGRAHAGHHHAGLGDVGRDVVWLHEVIVGRVGTLQTEAAEDHGFALAGVLVGKRHAAARHAELIITQCLHRGFARQGGAGRGVVDFVGRAHALHVQRGAGDGGAVLAAFQRVIASQATLAIGQHQGAVVDVLVGADVLVVEDAAAGQHQALAADQAAQGQQACGDVAAAVVGTHAIKIEDGPVDRQRTGLQNDVITLLAGIQIAAASLMATGVACVAIRTAGGAQDESGAGGASHRILRIVQASDVELAIIGLADAIARHGQGAQEAAQQRRRLAFIDAPDGMAAAGGRHVPAGEACLRAHLCIAQGAHITQCAFVATDARRRGPAAPEAVAHDAEVVANQGAGRRIAVHRTRCVAVAHAVIRAAIETKQAADIVVAAGHAAGVAVDDGAAQVVADQAARIVLDGGGVTGGVTAAHRGDDAIVAIIVSDQAAYIA